VITADGAVIVGLPCGTQPNGAFIHERAYVEQGCTVGARSKIWQFASLSRGAVLGEDCVVAPGAMVDGSKFGDRCKIGPGVKMGPGFNIGNDVFIGPNVVLCNDAWPSASVEGFDIAKLLSGEIVAIEIENGVSIGANATILPGIQLGECCFVAAGAVCGISVPAGCVFKRDGTIAPIHPAWKMRRMRRAPEPC
jgi:acetyltransferase-like isoleucine patch superfamily enzyme